MLIQKKLGNISAIDINNRSIDWLQLEWHEAGWQVELVRVPYDHELAARIAANRGRNDWAHYLRTGRGLHSTS